MLAKDFLGVFEKLFFGLTFLFVALELILEAVVLFSCFDELVLELGSLDGEIIDLVLCFGV